eukprot:jgi/Mesvir1/27141/Mv20810-RA.1
MQEVVDSSALGKDDGVIVRLEENVAYASSDNPWIKLYFDKVRFPDGKTGYYNRVVESDGRPGVVVLPLDAARCIGLIKIYRYALQAWSWELPRGFGDKGCSAEENARRELGEEMGMTGDFEHLGRLMSNTGISPAACDVYIARDCRRPDGAGFAPEATECISKTLFVTLADLRRMVRDGALSCGISLAAIQLAMAHDLL